MNRRGFLQAILAAGVAPWVITKAGVLMPVRKVIVPPPVIWHSNQLSEAAAEQWERALFQPIPTSGKSWLMVQEALRRARAQPESKIAIISGYPEPMRSLIESLAGPAGVPENLIHVPSHKGEKLA